MSKNWRPATKLVHGGTLRSQYGETSEAIFLTQGFVYDSSEAAEARFKGETDGFIYARYGSPTNDMFEKRMCLLEGAEDARATASGMAAVTAAILCQLKAGDHIVAARALFGSCRWVVETLAPKYGIECTLIDGKDLANWEKAIRPTTKVFFLESPTNPTLEVVDIAGVAKLANQIGAKVVVDNVFATPLFQKPLELGAHIVVYSATKHIDGQGRCLGGVVLSDKEWIDAQPARLFPPYRPGDVAVQCLGAAQGPRDHGAARQAADRECDQDRRFPRRPQRRSPASSIPAARTIRRPNSSPAR